MKRQTAITLSLIFVLFAAFVIKNRGCGSDVPDLEVWYEPADEIDVSGKDVSLNMIKKGNSWFINGEAYPGDAELIESLERKARDFKLLDLVSEKGYYDKYDLTEEKGLSVTIKSGGKELRKILIGKGGSSSNHSYLKIDDRKEIYLASGIMRGDFALPVSDLRSRVIFDVKPSDVKFFVINYGGRSFDFHLNPVKNGSDKNSENKDVKKPEAEWICRGYEKLTLKSSAVNSVLALFSPLRAADYPENTERKNLGIPVCTVKIVNGDKKIELEIYSRKDKDMYYASSSESKYIFTLGSWQTEKLFIKSITDLAEK